MDFDSLVADEIKVRVYGDVAVIVAYRSTARERKRLRMERSTSSAAGPASSFERTHAGSSCTLRGTNDQEALNGRGHPEGSKKSSMPSQSGR